MLGFSALFDNWAPALAQRSWTLHKRLNFDQVRQFGQTQVMIPVRNGLGHAHLEARPEPWMPKIIRWIFAKKTGLFVDVGANDGSTLLNVIEADPQASYVGFEPLAAEYAYVSELIALNRLKNCAVFPLALSDSDAIRTLRIAAVSTCSSIADFRATEFYAGSAQVYTSTGDAFMRHLAPANIAAIKVDVEGAEVEVFRGFSDTLARYRPFLIFEVLQHRSNNVKAENFVRELEKFLRAKGFDLRKITKSGDQEQIAELGERLAPDVDLSKVDWHDTNYLGIPK